jgi:hypothetical protein
MNSALLDLYTEYLPEINKLIKSCNWPSGVSKPFFMHVGEEYARAPNKILFIGRETYGWEDFNESDSPIPSIELYKNVYESNKHYNSPFWWFRQELSAQLGIKQDFMKATMWTNLSKIDVNKRTPSGDNSGELAQFFMKLLIEEIRIIQPDIVLILTKDGHYNWHLNNYDWDQNQSFKEKKPISSLKRQPILPKKIDRLIAENLLPKHTYQMCHPNALRRKLGGYRTNEDELIQALIPHINSI